MVTLKINLKHVCASTNFCDLRNIVLSHLYLNKLYHQHYQIAAQETGKQNSKIKMQFCSVLLAVRSMKIKSIKRKGNQMCLNMTYTNFWLRDNAIISCPRQRTDLAIKTVVINTVTQVNTGL